MRKRSLSGEGDGVVILALPRTEREADDLGQQQGIVELAIDRLGAGKPVVLVVPEASARLTQLARELAAAQLVQTTTPELQSDPAARTELNSRIDELQRQIAAEVERAFDPRRSGWFTGGERLTVTSWRDASRALSNLCNTHYDGAPPIRNELLNRRSLSTSAARARRNLIEAMILRGDVEQIGVRGQPARDQHVSLRAPGARAAPPSRRSVGIRGAEASAEAAMEGDRQLPSRDTEAGRRPLTELYDRLRRPPFGIKEGPLPVIVVAALLARDNDVAVYERGSFMPAWTPSHAERLLRSPDGFEIRRCQHRRTAPSGVHPPCRDVAAFHGAQTGAPRRRTRARAVRCELDPLCPPDPESLGAGSEYPRSSGPRPRAGATRFRRTADGLRVSGVRPESGKGAQQHVDEFVGLSGNGDSARSGTPTPR